jgi:hypothetical protein
MKPVIFKNSAWQSAFDRDGYILLDFIDPAALKTIEGLFYEIHPIVPNGFYSQAFSSDDEVKRTVFSACDDVLSQSIDLHFKDYNKLGSTFLSKGKGEEGKVGVHQDWYVVDETTSYSATIWIPTQDTDETNGTLRVLPGSHLFFDTLRSNNIPLRYRGSEQLLWDNMITVPVKAGQAFVLNHAVLHASAPNNSDKERLVIAYGIVPKKSSLSFYFRNEINRIEQYEMPDDFFQKYCNIGQRPTFGKLVKEFDYEVPKASEREMKFLMAQANKIIAEKKGIYELVNEKVLDERGYITVPLEEKMIPESWLTFSIPAFNDGQSLIKLVEEIQVVCRKNSLAADILIINDGSNDNTAEVAEHLALLYTNIRVVHHANNLGFGLTLFEAFTIPKTSWVFFLPGDNQFPAANIEHLLQYKGSFDFVLGKRSIRKDSLLRLLYAGFYNRLVSLLSGYSVEDVNGVAFFKSAIFEKVILRSKSSFIHAELFLEAKRNNYRVAEVAVEHKEREFGKGSGGKWVVIIPSVLDLIKYTLKKKQDAN